MILVNGVVQKRDNHDAMKTRVVNHAAQQPKGTCSGEVVGRKTELNACVWWEAYGGKQTDPNKGGNLIPGKWNRGRLRERGLKRKKAIG